MTRAARFLPLGLALFVLAAALASGCDGDPTSGEGPESVAFDPELVSILFDSEDLELVLQDPDGTLLRATEASVECLVSDRQTVTCLEAGAGSYALGIRAASSIAYSGRVFDETGLITQLSGQIGPGDAERFDWVVTGDPALEVRLTWDLRNDDLDLTLQIPDENDDDIPETVDPATPSESCCHLGDDGLDDRSERIVCSKADEGDYTASATAAGATAFVLEIFRDGALTSRIDGTTDADTPFEICAGPCPEP